MPYIAHINLDSIFQREDDTCCYLDGIDAAIDTLNLPPETDYLDAIAYGEQELQRKAKYMDALYGY